MTASDLRQPRAPGLSVRLKLTFSYAGFLVVAGLLLLAVVWVFLLRYVPEVIVVPENGARRWPDSPGPMVIPNRSDLIAAFAPKAALMVGLLLVFGLVGGWFLAGRMLAPLARISDAARRAGDGSLSHRIHLDGRSDEFRELADTFDAMLAQLEAHMGEQQRFAANASHELRTPLAITQTLLDVARSDPGAADATLIDRLRVVNSRAIDLTQALLMLSRADQRSFVRERVDLALLAEDATESLLPLAEKHGVTMSIVGGIAPTTGSHPLLLQMMMNLTHNAIVHNLADNGSVRIATSAEAGAANLTVENTGAHLSPQLVSTLTEPFQRGTERTRGDHPGVGLGLAIVTSVVAAHEGTISLVPRAAGGLSVTIRLPAPDRAAL